MADEWYYTNQGKQVGPVNETLLKQLASTNFLRPTDLVWKQGYPQWVPASSIPGLFAHQQMRPAATPAPGSYPASGSYPAPAAAAGSESYEYREPAGETGYDDEYYQERRQRRKKRSKTGVPMGLIIGLVVGGGFALILIIGIIVWAVSSNKGGGLTSGGGNTDSKSGNGSYFVPNLAVNPQGQEKLMHHQQIWLNSGTTVTINVQSQVEGDVDCYLDSPGGGELAKDTGLSKNCFLTVPITQTGYHTVVLDNLGNMPNRCNVTYSSK